MNKVGKVFFRHWGKITVIAFPVAIWLTDPLGCDEIGKVYDLSGKTVEDPSLEKVRKWVAAHCPASASDIKVVVHMGDILGGASETLVCHVEPEAMKRFTEESGRMWRYDSTVQNDNTNGVPVRLEMPGLPDDAWLAEWNKARQSKNYWSYFNVYGNNGGTRMVYFVETKTLFFDRSSN